MSKKTVVVEKGLLDEATRSLQGCIGLIEQIRGGGRFRFSWGHIREILSALTSGHWWFGYPLPSEFSVFRGRFRNDVEHFQNVKDLSFRPTDCVSDYGRCHKPGFSVFYGANNLDTVLSELSPEIGDHVHIAIAKLRSDKAVNVTAVGEIEHVRRYGRALIGNDQARQYIQTFLDNAKSEMDIKTILMDAFLSDLFVTPASSQKDYKVTSALSDIVFSFRDPQHGLGFDGFAYPSVAHRGGTNYAFRSESFSQSMEIYHCMAFEITDYLGFGIYGRRKYAEGKSISEDGIIQWESI